MGISGYFRRLFVVAVALSALSACGYAEWPPRDGVPSDANRAPARGPGDSAFVNATAVVVGKGDSVYALSRRHRVPMRAIIEANGLRPPFTLRVGQRITLPRGPVHVVQKGDTLLGIGNRYNVDPYEVARLNGVKPPYVIRVGEPLTLPVGGGGWVKTLAVSPNADAADLGGGPGLAPLPDAPPAARQAETSAEARSLAEVAVPRRPARTAQAPRTPRPGAPSKPARVPTPPPKSVSGFLWPVEGRVISGFGVKAKGLRNDGINIAAARGTPVRAAENGVVAYAGNELRGFGNLLLIKHSSGWVTAYAHNDKVLVQRGQRIRKGDTVATVGSSGSVTRPQLHFEIRKGRKARDPRKLLKGRA